MPAPASPRPRRRVELVVALACYLAFLALLVGWPTRVDAPLGARLYEFVLQLHDVGVPVWVTYGGIEFAANTAVFVPVALLLALALRSGQWWFAVLTGFGLSLLAEIGQGLLRPERIASARDVAANTLGTLIGVGIAVWITRRVEVEAPAV